MEKNNDQAINHAMAAINGMAVAVATLLWFAI